MISRLNEQFQLKVDYPDPLIAQRARNLLYFLAFATVIFVILSGLLVLTFFQADSSFNQGNLFILLVPIFTVGFFILVQRYGYYRESTIGFVVLSLLILILRISTNNEDRKSVV